MSRPTPLSTSTMTVNQAKLMAKRLQMLRGRQGEKLKYSYCLERIAHAYGYRDWNTMVATLKRKELDERTNPQGRSDR